MSTSRRRFRSAVTGRYVSKSKANGKVSNRVATSGYGVTKVKKQEK